MKTGREMKDERLRIGLQLNDDAAYYTIPEFAEKYGYSTDSIRVMLMRGQIAGALKVDGKWMISENADILVDQYAKKNKLKV